MDWPFGRCAGGYLDSAMVAAALGVLLWAALSVILLPLLMVRATSWLTEGCAVCVSRIGSAGRWYSTSLGIVLRALFSIPTAFNVSSTPHELGAGARQPRLSFSAVVSQASRRRFIWSGHLEADRSDLSNSGKRHERLVVHSNAGGGGRRQFGGGPHQQSATHQFATDNRRSRESHGHRPRKVVCGSPRTPRTHAGQGFGQQWRRTRLRSFGAVLGGVSSYVGMSDVQAVAFDFKSLADFCFAFATT